MVLTFAEDFSSSVALDSELTGTPESGLFLNRGVIPLLTTQNLLNFLPIYDPTFTAWSSATTYGKYETTRKISDIVTYGGKIYQSLLASNLNKTPGIQTSYWLETNDESLRIKSFYWNAIENLTSALSLSKRLIENQYIYNVGETLVDITDDYIGWCFEPKGSDYAKIVIKQIALQANTSDTVSLYVVNQGALITTLTLNPQGGKLVFEDVGYTIPGKGKYYFIIAGQDVYSEQAYNDPLKYTGFVCYPVIGDGATPQGAEFTESSNGNGFNFNISVYTDTSQYITNNLAYFGKALQAQCEYDFIQMLQFNSNARVHGEGREITSDKNLLTYHASDLTGNTVARRYRDEIKLAKESIDRTFDKFLKQPKQIRVTRGVI
jgi:hypothetical protein